MIKCVIFDLDGTLLNTVTSITYYINKALEEEGIEPITEADTKIFIGNGAKKLIERTLAYRGITDAPTVERITKKYSDSYNGDPYYLTRPYDGIPELIDSLKSRGYSIGVLSNKPEETLVPIVEHFFGDVFNTVRGGRDSESLKPNPKSTLDMLSEMGYSPSELAFIGDTSVDILTAKNSCAALSIGVSWGFRDIAELTGSGADKIADTADEVLKFISGVL